MKHIVVGCVILLLACAAVVATNPVYVPTYSARATDDHGRELLTEVRLIRQELQAMRRGAVAQPTTLKDFVSRHCAACHGDEAKTKGGGFVLVSKGDVVPLSLVEKRQIQRMTAKGSMPPNAPLTESEKQVLSDLLFPKE